MKFKIFLFFLSFSLLSIYSYAQVGNSSDVELKDRFGTPIPDVNKDYFAPATPSPGPSPTPLEIGELKN